MLGITATIRVVEGRNAEFEEVVREVMSSVRANEPGNLLYQLVRSRKDPQTYMMMELYKGQSDLDAHMQSDHYKAMGPRLKGLVAGPVDVAFYDAI